MEARIHRTQKKFITTETKNILLYTSGVLISMFGSSIYTFAIGLYVLNQTSSGMSFSLTLLFGFLPGIILNPIAGVYIDRFNKKKIAVHMDTLNGLLFGIVFIVALTNGLSLALIYASTLLTNIFTTIFRLTMNVSRPQLVSKGKLLGLNAKGDMINSIANISGPFVGGIVFALININFFILLNGVSFIFSALLEAAMDFDYNRSPNNVAVQQSFTSAFKDGLAYISRSSSIKRFLMAFALLNFILPFAYNITGPVILTQHFMLDSSLYGVIQGLFPIGTILGALTIQRLISKLDYGQILKFSTLMQAVTIIGLSFPLFINALTLTSLALYYGSLNLILGVAITYVNIPIMYFVQTQVEENYRGRVLSLGTTASGLSIPFGLLLGGALVNSLPLYVLPIIGGLLLITVMLPLLKRASHLSLD